MTVIPRRKAVLKTRAVQTLRDCRTSSNYAKRLECGAFTAFTAAFSCVEIVCHALPQPGLLPKEKENRSPSHSKTCDWIRRTGIRKTRDGQLLLTLKTWLPKVVVESEKQPA